MSIKRQSYTSDVILQAESPLVIPHGSFIGLGLSLSSAAAILTVEADVIEDGAFETLITMHGVGETFRYPDIDGMNVLYNCKYVRLTWNTGTLQYFQKG